MMQEHTITIEGITYTTKTMGCIKGLKVMVKLVALFGAEGLDIIFKMVAADVSEEERAAAFGTPQVIGRLLAAVAKNAADDEVDGGGGIMVISDLLVGMKADKVKVGDAEVPAEIFPHHFDSHFDGRYMHLAQVAMWAAKVNFGGL